MKRICVLLLALLMLTACGAGQSEAVPPSPPAKEPSPTTVVTPPAAPAEPDDAVENAQPETPLAPSEEEVLAMRARVEEGMTEEEIFRLTDFIKASNQRLENAWFNKDIFGKLSDPENVYWAFFERTGEIQIGWGEMDGEQVPVVAVNDQDAAFFISVLEELKPSVKSGLLDEDLGRLMELCSSATETHKVDYVVEMYHMLHDLDYFLLRYGLSDVRNYVTDASTISQYYGSLAVWRQPVTAD
ncbi:MAG: hypothetical protein ACI4PC_05235 [Oscillospiraceae bacterium]